MVRFLERIMSPCRQLCMAILGISPLSDLRAALGWLLLRWRMHICCSMQRQRQAVCCHCRSPVAAQPLTGLHAASGPRTHPVYRSAFRIGVLYSESCMRLGVHFRAFVSLSPDNDTNTLQAPSAALTQAWCCVQARESG